MKTIKKNIFRTLLVAAVLVMGKISMKAAETSIWSSGPSGQVELDASAFSDVSANTVMRVYADAAECFAGYSYNWNWVALWATSDYPGNNYIRNWNSDLFSEFYNSTKKCFEFTITDTELASLQEYGFVVQVSNITNITLEAGGEVVVTPKYTLTYQSQDATVKTEKLEKDATPTPPADPVRYDGYTFTGWKGLPEKMPENDLTVTAQFMLANTTTYESTTTYAMKAGDTHTSGETVNVTSGDNTVATLTFGEAGGADFKAAKADASVSGFTAFTEGNGENGNKTGGTFYTITPKYDGYITVGIALNAGKAFYVLEDGTAVTGYDGISNATKKYGTYSFSVKAGKAYKFYCSGSKLGFYGFSYSYTIIYKKLTYYVDYEEKYSENLEVGATITLKSNPTKEGYTFSGWSGYPEDLKMPNQDVSINGYFTINTYKVIYMLDGEPYTTKDWTYGYDLYAENNPVKEGYTFSGWSGFPDDMKMPAHDLTITGSFSKDAAKSYTITYYVDGEFYTSKTVEEKTTVTTEPKPTKEGYTFNGWYNEPTTMPSQDCTVTGNFQVNTYTITFVVDGETLRTENYQFGATVYSPDVQAKEGYVFSGWSNLPETMPAGNITVTGSYISTSATVWKTTADNAATGGTTLVNDDVITATTVYDAKVSSASKTIAGETFTHYLQLRVAGDPTADTPTGTQQKDCTPIVITAKQNTEVTLYYRRQADSDAPGQYTLNAGKDLKVVDQSAPGIPLDGVEAVRESDENYGFVTKTVFLKAGSTYTISARGTTINFYGFSYQAAAAVKHTLTYLVNDQPYKTVLLEEGAEIPHITDPYFTGYVFKGWDGLTDTMPGEDLAVTAQFDLALYTITFVYDGEVYATIEKYYGTIISDSDLPVIPSSGGDTTFSGWQNVPETMPANNLYIYGHTVKESQYVELSVGASGCNTYCGDQPLYFQGSEAIKAYIATKKSSTTVTLTQVIGSVAAGTGLVLIGTANTSALIEVAEVGSTYSENLLVGVSGFSETINSASQYVLVNKSGVVKFADTAGYPATVYSGKAYLNAPAGSRELTIVFSDETTGIAESLQSTDATEDAFNLSGQRVATPRRGLYIVGGKKVFVK